MNISTLKESAIVRSILRKPYLLLKTTWIWLHKHISPTERHFSRIWPKINSIEGLLVPGQERWLYDTARSLPPRSVIVEIGSFKGRSTICLAYGCKGKKGHVYAIDTFRGNDKDFFREYSIDEFTANINRMKLSDIVTHLIGESAEIAQTWNKPINMLFIDGSHVYEDVLMDFNSFFPWVVKGGMVALHDVGNGEGFPGVYRVWHETAASQLFNTGACSTLSFGFKP